MIEIIDIKLEQGADWYEERTTSADYYLLVLMSYGKCVYWIDGSKTIVEKGDILLIPPHATYYGKHVPTVFHEKHIAAFRLPPVSQPDVSDKETQLLLRNWQTAKTGMYELLLEHFKKLQSEWTEQLPYYTIRCQGLMLEMLALRSRELHRGQLGADIYKHAERMKGYIQNHYREHMTKEKLGVLLGISPNYAASVFKRATGQTISEFTHAIRVRTAVYMLTESMLTVAEVASFLGYNDVSYFHKVFKRTTGTAPVQYVKLHRS